MDKLINSGIPLRKAIAMGMADKDMKSGGKDAKPKPEKKMPKAKGY